MKAQVQPFFHAGSNTFSYVVSDPDNRHAAVIDPVLDFDVASGRTGTASAEAMVDYIDAHSLQVAWLLETHAHADHLSAAHWLRTKRFPRARIGIGEGIATVQKHFRPIFNLGKHFPIDGSQFDHLFADGETFTLGNLEAIALHVPGHTPADMAFVIGDAAFIGDTLFMPDYGTARADFPGGDARQLYRSIRRLLALPGETRLFLCHDYKAPGRDHFAWETTVAQERAENVHVKDGMSEDSFVDMRNARDKTLAMPRLIMPSVQVNIRGGHLPAPEDNGVSYIKIPVNAV